MIRRPPRSTRIDTLFPYTTLCRSDGHIVGIHDAVAKPCRLPVGHQPCRLDRDGTQESQHHVGLHGGGTGRCVAAFRRSEEHTSELQSLMRISYAVFCLKKKKVQSKKI